MVMFQMSGIGPMFGRLHHFVQYAPEQIPYSINRYRREVDRLRYVINRHLDGRDYMAGDYSIADIACYPWIRGMWKRYPPAQPTPHLERWSRLIGERPAVQKGMSLLVDRTRDEVKGLKRVDQHTWDVLFGAIQHAAR
jgi:GST-like protein